MKSLKINWYIMGLEQKKQILEGQLSVMESFEVLGLIDEDYEDKYYDMCQEVRIHIDKIQDLIELELEQDV